MFPELRICWSCGSIGEESMHCIICDKDSEVCECEDPVLWEHYRCPECGATW
jgi:hypothetical protein